ncbi:2OG-Fe(II) oxygenase [Aliiglaciecola sp. CAU 1673]|uniref:prolyl hydroxylase family protein n=1 Tax=Aliiglaciecola sp. CAU 1673 TaxID=3032595 RepID=UPI0023DA9209|nr:2OG-Fe(II) oxygenase [Aliiglaciecola sp. CAU 1673]MDF2178054.1 2OG-Fe(II) oxygenase [Aliiglaciecola sp. CAU 1673]
MKLQFNEQWKHWLQTNLDAGHHKDSLFKILLDEGFDHQLIKQEMGYEPSIPTVLIANPLHGKQQSSKSSKEYDKSPYLQRQGAQSFCSDLVEMYKVDDFIGGEACKRLIALIKDKLQPSQLSSKEADSTFRTSSTCYLGTLDDPLIAEVDQQICDYLGIAPAYGEVIQGQYYETGQEFKAHTDYFEDNELPFHGATMGQRTYTFMLYLNDVQSGGETKFPRIGESFTPKAGTALIWNSLLANGQGNYNTLHHAMPVKSGTKVIITKWFRQRPAC